MIRFFNGIVLIVLFGLGCKDESTESCMDVSFGQVQVDPGDKIHLPYQGNETLVFKDSLGQELSFDAQLSFNPYFLDAIDSITEGPCAGKAVAYGKLEHTSFSFKNDSLGSRLTLSHYVYYELDEDQPIFYDILSCSYFKPGQTFPYFLPSIYTVTDERGNDLSQYFIYEHYQFVDEINLLSKTFSDVYIGSGMEQSAVYFNLEFGFVGFKEEAGTLWVLDRIE